MLSKKEHCDASEPIPNNIENMATSSSGYSMAGISRYQMLKICLLLSNKQMKDFAKDITHTTPQHVTMVSKGEVTNYRVIRQIDYYIEKVLKDNASRIGDLGGYVYGRYIAKNTQSVTLEPDDSTQGNQGYQW